MKWRLRDQDLSSMGYEELRAKFSSQAKWLFGEIFNIFWALLVIALRINGNRLFSIFSLIPLTWLAVALGFLCLITLPNRSVLKCAKVKLEAHIIGSKQVEKQQISEMKDTIEVRTLLGVRRIGKKGFVAVFAIIFGMPFLDLH